MGILSVRNWDLEKDRNCEGGVSEIFEQIGQYREGLKFATTKPDSGFTADDSRSSVGRKIIPLTLNDQDRAVLEEEQAILREGKMLEEQYGYCGYS